MANTFLTLEGLQHYDSKLKAVAVGGGDISGRTISLKSISGEVVATIDIPQTVYELASATTQGLMSAEMYVKLDGITEGATKTEASGTNGKLTINGTEVNVYVHPTGAQLASGLYKIETDANGHVKTGAAVTKADITALGIPAQDTTYEEATQAKSGLLSAADKAKLDDITDGATFVEASATNGNVKIDGQEVKVYTHDSHTAHAAGLYKVTVDDQGHVTAATAVAKSDITGLGIPAQDTTYTEATADKAGLESAAHYTKVEGIAAGAQVNVLEKVSVNGEALTINSKGVNIDLTDYAKKSDVVNVYKFMGSVATYSALPTSGNEGGHVYNIEAADAANNINAGDNVAWNAETQSWDKLAGIFTVSGISNSEIDALFA